MTPPRSGDPVLILDGPMGSVLEQRGYALPPPGWSAYVLRDHPEAIAQIHREYAEAGATLHTACTFRTHRRNIGDDWERLTRLAVRLARESVPKTHRVAGSVAPLEDNYRPDLSPPNPGPEHAALARVLADAGVDLLLCESFAHVGEGLAAVEACVATGLPTWASFSSGPENDLLTPEQIGAAAREAVRRGASAVLVNCTRATEILPFLHELRAAGVPYGAYANAGPASDGIGWGAGPEGVSRYTELARTWVDAGARIVGGCCGTDARHIAALRRAFAPTTATDAARE